MVRLLSLVCILWLAIGPAFAQPKGPPGPNGPKAPPTSSGGALTPLSSEQHILRPGDQIEFHISALPELPTSYQVRVDGHFFHPIVGEIMANGKTLGQLRTELKTLLAKELRNPNFRLGILEVARHQVAVLGEANSQGTFDVGVGASVLDVIAAAGGLTEKADRDRAVLLRGDEKLEVSLKPEAGGGLTKVRSGDVLYILPGSPISVTGEVIKPGIYAVSRVSGGVREAILAAGGAKEEASLTRVRLIRGSLPAPIVFDITPGSGEPIPLEAQQLEEGDILVVPARQAVVLGAVGSAGPVPLRGGETLLDILPAKISGESDITKIMVIRAENVKDNRDKTEEYNLKEYFEEGKADAVIPIYDGDIVYVPAKGKGGFFTNILNVIGLGRSFLFF
jgi:protein involved in polysaccharide export with SLBB domain